MLLNADYFQVQKKSLSNVSNRNKLCYNDDCFIPKKK